MESFEQIRISYAPSRPPPDYVFVPKGDVYITRNCHTLSQKVGKATFDVYKEHPKEKLGLHCHSQVLEAVRVDAALTAERREKAVAAKDSLDYRRNRESLFTEFPEIPEESALEILSHGFLKGSGRVGRAKVLEEKLRVNLATNAHIRHKLTAYDSILAEIASSEQRQHAKRAAREKINDQVQEIADSWRPKSRSNPQHRPGERRNRRTPAATRSTMTLERNRSRRKDQAKPRHTQEGREMKAAEEILELLRLEGAAAAARTRVEPSNNEEEALQQALQKLDLEPSGVSIGKYQRRRAAIRGDLERLKRDPTIQMPATRLADVLKMHRNEGGEIASLKISFTAQMDARPRVEAGGRAARRARRTVVRNRMNEEEAHREIIDSIKNFEFQKSHQRQIISSNEPSGTTKSHQRHIDSYMIAPVQKSKRLIPPKGELRQQSAKESEDALVVAGENDALYQKSSFKMRLEEEVRQLIADENENGSIAPGKDEALTSGQYATVDFANLDLPKHYTSPPGCVPGPTTLKQGDRSERPLVIRQMVATQAGGYQPIVDNSAEGPLSERLEWMDIS